MARLISIFLLLLAFLPYFYGFSGWVDPDTPEEKKKIRSFSDKNEHVEYELVMSDEFNKNGRQFHDGYDPMWTGIDRSDDDQTSQGRKSLQFYNSSYIRTENGSLVIRTTTEDTKWRGWNPYMKKYDQMQRHFRSGMVQSWNKFCFTGGILEVSVKFPGRADVGGLWPAVWLLGNLGRATFEGSTNLMWPWSYKKCDRDLQHAQEISGCDITSHYNLVPGRGRGATEIDVVEVMSGPNTPLPIVKNHVTRPYGSMTLQIAPGIPTSKHRPFSGTLPEWGFNWYKNLSYGENTSINPFFYGTYLAPTKTAEPVSRSKAESYQADAISSMVQLTKDHWDNFHTFRLEWQPGDNGYVHWYSDDKFRFGVEAEGLKLQDSQIPEEPSYIILNTAISTSWGFPTPPPGCTNYDCKDITAQCGMNPGFCKSLPAEFFVDYVRVYQNKRNDSRQTIGCNPREFPTKRFIKAHAYRYKGSTQEDPLLPILHGGGKCHDDLKCGQGKCVNKKCKCPSDWTGPFCLVPDYKNDFADWDVDHWFEFQMPYIPSELYYTFLTFALALLFTAYLIFRRKNSTMYLSPDEKNSSWL